VPSGDIIGNFNAKVGQMEQNRTAVSHRDLLNRDLEKGNFLVIV